LHTPSAQRSSSSLDLYQFYDALIPEDISRNEFDLARSKALATSTQFAASEMNPHCHTPYRPPSGMCVSAWLPCYALCDVLLMFRIYKAIRHLTRNALNALKITVLLA
jgi:hypothetical protein